MRPGLYYPYIHIRDINWLKASLLIFPKMYRIVPREFNRWDDPASSEFARMEGREGPLLAPAYTYDSAVETAAQWLLRKLKSDAENPEFLARLSKERALEQREKRRQRLEATQAGLGDLDDTVRYGAQLHTGKFCEELMEFLAEKNLSWPPDHDEATDPDRYVEVHEFLAEVIVSTVAIAFAQRHGTDIVSDGKHEPLHRFLVDHKYEELYRSWLHPELPVGPEPLTGRRTFEFMIEWQGDVSTLTPHKIIELTKEKDAISDLIDDLHKRTANIQAWDPRRIDEQMKDEISVVLSTWQQKNRPGSRWWKEFAGTDAVELGTDMFKTLGEKAATPAVAGVAAGAYVGSLDAGGLVVAGIGLAIGVIGHGIASLGKAVNAKRTDPHRYLTSLTKAGVKLNVPIHDAPLVPAEGSNGKIKASRSSQ